MFAPVFSSQYFKDLLASITHIEIKKFIIVAKGTMGVLSGGIYLFHDIKYIQTPQLYCLYGIDSFPICWTADSYLLFSYNKSCLYLYNW